MLPEHSTLRRSLDHRLWCGLGACHRHHSEACSIESASIDLARAGHERGLHVGCNVKDTAFWSDLAGEQTCRSTAYCTGVMMPFSLA